MGNKNANHGAIAYSGLIYQSLYAIIVSMNDDRWNAIKVEPLTSKDKTDIALYDSANIRLLNDSKTSCYKKIQVKKRTASVSNNNISEWCKDLENDDKAECYELCLYGTVKKGVPSELRGNVRVYNNDINEVIKNAKIEIKEYFKKNGVEDYSDEDNEAAYYALFHTVCINTQEKEAISRDRLNNLLKDILKRSPYNKAAQLKQKSLGVFYENKPYSRDLKTPRLDETGTNVVYENLSKKDFPELKSAIFEKTRYNLFDYFFEHVKDKSTRRHIFISGASGSGKSTYLYGIWKECLTINYYIPIYVPLYNVESSIKKYIVDQYLSHVSIKNFNWIKGDGFKKTPYHIILLLDGFNELSENSPKISERLVKEINSFLTTEKITVLITSRNPVLKLNNEITRLKMCQLTNDQIKRFLGGNDEFLEASWYRGLLDNPFMLEICIKTFSDKKTGINCLSQTSMGMIFKEYFDKQTGREGQNKQIKSIELSVVYRLIVDIILPLVAMELDKKDDDIEICKDDKQIKWAVFRDAVNSVSDRLEEYSDSIEFCINENEGYQEHLDKIYNLQNEKALAAFILDAGRKLEVFSDKSKRGNTVIWDHEIYRDYFVARGYALFSAAHENSEIMVANLGRQINYRYPEPGFKNTKVTPTIRQYHVRKAQMYVDLIDAMLTDESEFDDENIEKLKETAVYRRLVRDIALIYEDLKDNKMMKAADLGLKYYKSDLEMYNILSEYDINYREAERRYADAAYSISSLAYNYTHDRFRIKRKGEDLEYDKEYDKESRLYLKKACIALKAADSIFNRLSDEMKRNSTVRDDILKCQGNLAAYNIGMYKITGDKKYLDAAKEIHENNERERRKIMRLMDKEGGDLVQIKNDIASSYNGIATCFYYMKEYKTAIEYQRKAAAIRPRNNYDGKCMAYRNIIGCYAKLNDYNSYEAEQIVKRIRSTLNLIIRESIYAGYDQLKTNIEIIINKLSDDQKIEYEKVILAINNKLIRISRNSLN